MELELRDYLRILRKRKWVVVLALFGCLGGAAFFTATAEPSYEAEAKILVGEQQVRQTEIAEGVQVTQLSFQLLKTYAALIRTRPIAEVAVEKEGLSLSPTELTDSLQADPVLDTQIIELRYTHNDAAVAQRVVNAVAEAFVEDRAMATAEGEPAVEVSVVEPALQPEIPVSPRPVRNMALAIVLGVMLGVGLAFVVEYLDVSVKGREDVEEQMGLPVLAAIPKIDTGGSETYLERDSQSPGAEAFRKLRTAIQFLGVDEPVGVVLVTSPFAQDGKTTTALNLAAAYAQAGLRTILVEADMRRPSLHKVFPSDGQKGLTTVLIGKIPLEQAILPTHVRNLSHVPAGALPPNPAELLASEQAAELMGKLRASADVVVVDAPPLLPVADASALASRVDGVVIVCRVGQTNRDRVREAAELTGKVGGRLLGIVLNQVRQEPGQDRYYYYGYRSKGTAFESRSAEPPATA